MSFEQQLAVGQAGESAISRYLRSRDWFVAPVYEKIIENGKGPRIFAPSKTLVAPDLLAWKGENAYWIEAKHKDAFTWHRITSRWTTGIDMRHWEHYCEVDENSPFPVWLMFLHRGGQAKDSPRNSPAGLFAGALKTLCKNINHTSDRWGNSGMVYWAHDSLKLLATFDADGELRSV